MTSEAPDMKTMAGRTLGRYNLIELVGQGGMATVYKAFDPTQERYVAVKILSPVWDPYNDFDICLRREANIVVQLRHEHIVPVEYFGEEDGFTYAVMPYHPSGTLADRLNNRPLTITEAAHIIAHVANALDYAHGRGVVHLDIKPSNILIDENGNASLTDFGLAQIYSTSFNLAGSAVIGTPAYMSPEQARGEKVDHKSDQYSLGVILYLLVTNRLPFPGKTPKAVLNNHLHSPMPSPRSINPNIPRAIERVIFKSTAKNPEHRFASIGEMNKAFRAALAHSSNPKMSPEPKIDLPLAAEPTMIIGISKLTERPEQRRWLRVASAVLLVLLLLSSFPVIASSILGLSEHTSKKAEIGQLSGIGLSAVQLTVIASTIEEVSTNIDSRNGVLPSDHIQTAVAQTTITPGGFDEGNDDESATPLIGSTPSVMALLDDDTLALSPTATTEDILVSSPTAGASLILSSTPFPTASLTATPTSPLLFSQLTPFIYSTQTQTSTQAPSKTTTRTPTQTHSPTPTATPSPPNNVCSTAAISSFRVSGRRVSWMLINDGSATINITEIRFGWPSGNGTLKRVKLEKKIIWSKGDSTSPTTITSGWKDEQREVKPESDKNLAFEFSNNAQLQKIDYSLSIILNNSCRISD